MCDYGAGLLHVGAKGFWTAIGSSVLKLQHEKSVGWRRRVTYELLDLHYLVPEKATRVAQTCSHGANS